MLMDDGVSELVLNHFDGNEIVDVGQTYKGMILKDVTKVKTSGVVLEYEGKTRFLATGHSL